MKPLISVLIDTCNQERFIEQAIASAIEQDFPRSEYEILVVDDGSTDRTPEIVRKFEPRVRLLRKENGGQGSAINFGMTQARGEFIALLDGDDIWLPHKLSRVMPEFERRKDAVMVYHNFRFWDDRENTTWDGWFCGISGDVLADRRTVLEWAPPPTSSLAFRRSTLERLMPLPMHYSFMHDSFLTATAICLGPIGAIRECLTINRVHGQNRWFAERGETNPWVLRERVRVRKALVHSVRRWIRENGARSCKAHIRALTSAWQLRNDSDEFRVRKPDRFRYFVYECRRTMVYRPTITRLRFAYDWLYALTRLVLGPSNADYLESIRTPLLRLLRSSGLRSQTGSG